MKRRPRELSLKQCYEALALAEGADLEALKTAYRRRAFELHPDLHPDNPQAGREFQVVNEAYVILARLLDSTQKHSAAGEKTTDAGADSGPKHQTQTQEKASDDRAAHSEGDAHEQHEEPRDAEATAQHTRRAAHAAYAREEDVLRDLLNDPFARRVFEDIYAQVQDARTPPPPPQEDAGGKNNSRTQIESEWGWEQLPLDWSQGIGKAVKTWMRRQIDEELTLYLPPSVLRPGARFPLRIRRGMSEEVSTVEVKLPQEYTEGKPVRLKGMGRHIGRWRGDLYLTLVAKQ